MAGKNNRAKPKSDGTSSPPPAPETLNPLLNPTDAMHARQLTEIEARGEDPRRILRDFDAMMRSLRAAHSPSPTPTDIVGLDAAGLGVESESMLRRTIRFEEAVAAGTPVPTEATGRPARLADLLHGIDPEGKLLVSVSGSSMTGTHIQDGDIVLVDPRAEIRDGDLVVAYIAGHGQVVKRLRVAPCGDATLESENPDFAPIKIADSADLRIHGKVVWRSGLLR